MFTPERTRAILEERARRLARPLDEPDADPGRPVAVIAAGGERYAVDLPKVARIYGRSPVTPLPGVASPWLGVVSLRGELYPVLDLPAYLGRAGVAAGGHCVLLAHERLRVAVMSDDPPEIARVLEGALSPHPAGTGAPPGAVAGLTSDLLVVLDVGAVLAHPAFAADDAGPDTEKELQP
jgi:chemotaxis signal transduction protein